MIKDVENLKKSITDIEKELIKVENIMDDFKDLKHTNEKIQLAVLELDKKLSNTVYKLSNVESFIKNDQGKWDKIWGFITQIVLVIASTWILISLGLNS